MEMKDEDGNHQINSFLRDTFPLVFLTLSDKKEFPKNPLERCHARWLTLFLEILRAIGKKNPALIRGLSVALENSGLTSPDLFDANPSDETLQRIVKLENKLTIPKMKKGESIETKLMAIKAFIDFSIALSEFKDFSKAVGNTKYPGARIHKGLLYLKKRIPRIVSFMDRVGSLKQKDVPDTSLRKWTPLPKRELVRRLTAYLSGIEDETFKKLLTQARRENPGLARLWKNGIEIQSPD